MTEPDDSTLRRRVADLESENEALRAQLDAARNSALENWAESAAHESASVAELKRSVSWRVTAPLRTVRSLQIRLTGSR